MIADFGQFQRTTAHAPAAELLTNVLPFARLYKAIDTVGSMSIMPDVVQMQPLLVEMAIEPKWKAEQEKLGIALAKLCSEDPSFRVSRDPESGHSVLKGTSESHLEAKVDILKRSGIEIIIGAPQVAYFERPTERVEHRYVHKKQSGGSGQFAAVKIVVEPNEPGKGYEFESKIVGGTVPKEYIPPIKKGIESVLTLGVVAGFPVVDVRVELVDGAYHQLDSSALAFEIASRAAFREALKMAKPVLLEPIMKIEVKSPSEYAKSVIDDLVLRRGEIERRDVCGEAATINAMVPLANMFGYSNALGVMSRGRAAFTMQFAHYAPAAPLPEDDPPFPPAIGMRA
jgi:elongation factor G